MDSAKVLQLKEEISALKQRVQAARSAIDNNSVTCMISNSICGYVVRSVSSQGNFDMKHFEIKQRRFLKGHFGKVYCMQWSCDSNHLASVSQDGKLIIWNSKNAVKSFSIPLKSSWMTACAYSPSGTYVATAGLENVISIFNIASLRNDSEIELHVNSRDIVCAPNGKDQFATCARFLRDDIILTSHNDGSICTWDVGSMNLKHKFQGHEADTLSIALAGKYRINPNVNPNTASSTETEHMGPSSFSQSLFISGSVDCTVRVWDMRAKKQVAIFRDHESEVNSVEAFPDGYSFGSGSDDGTVRLFDIRTMKQLSVYRTTDSNENTITSIGSGRGVAVTSIAFSLSGRFIYGGCDDYQCRVWDTVTGNALQNLNGHEGKISSIGVTPNGKALCTASWDTTLRIWA